jgi:23S rRNA pseudouridine1911/1915/1917 synthase
MLNRGYAYTTIIGSKHHGQTLLSHLAGLYPHSTAEVWQQNLNNGEVTLNGVTATGSESVTSGQTLVWNRPPWIEPDVPRHFEVLFDDPHLLAVNKPSGLPTLPGGGFMENTLLRLVQRQTTQKQTPNANPVHRLGRGTSGIVLFAKTPQAAANLFANWNTPKVQKIYRALAQNIAEHDAYEILTPIGLVPHPRLGQVWAAKPGGKPSKSLAKVISRSASNTTGAITGTTTFEVSLYSGRPHQIRIHLASIGHPLLGDPLYGTGGQPLENLPGLPGDGGYLLHAQFLKFHHPITGEQIELEAALPAGFSPVPNCDGSPPHGLRPFHGDPGPGAPST